MRKTLNFALLAATLFLKPALLATETIELPGNNDTNTAVVLHQKDFLTETIKENYRMILSYLTLSELYETMALSKLMLDLFIDIQNAWVTLSDSLSQPLSPRELKNLLNSTYEQISYNCEIDNNSQYARQMLLVLKHFSIAQEKKKNQSDRFEAINELRKIGKGTQAFLARIYLSDALASKNDDVKTSKALKGFKFNTKIEQEVASVLIPIARSSKHKALDVADAVRTIKGFSKENIINTYLAVSRNPNIKIKQRIKTALQILEIDPESKTQVIDALTFMKRNSKLSINDKNLIQEALHQIGDSN